jgi:Holliday junction resolvase RusA-like endonuclease
MTEHDFKPRAVATLPGVILRLILPMPHRLLSPNARTHWAAKARAVKSARDKGKWAAQKVLHDAGLAPPKWEKAHYKVIFFCRTAAKRDNDNLMASLKSYRDGIADSGLVADDCGMWPRGCEIKKDASNPRCEIVIWEVEA